MVKQLDGNTLIIGSDDKDESTQKKAKVLAWLLKLGNPYLSDTGLKNYSTKFRLPLEEFQAIVREFQHCREGLQR